MRSIRALPLVVLALVGCEAQDRAQPPSIARVSQATVDDGTAEAQNGQPDFATSTSQPPLDGLSSPRGITIEPSATFFPGGANVVWVADTGYDRTFRIDTAKLAARSDLFGQSTFDGSSPNRGGPIGPDGVDGPFDISHVYGEWLVADTNNHRVLVGSSGGFGPSFVLGQAGSFDSGVRNLGGVSSSSLAEPKGASIVFNPSFGNMVAVADAGNHRLLLYQFGDVSALAVVGQPDFVSFLPNHGGAPSGAGLRDPHDVERATPYDPGLLADPRHAGFLVADTGNHRVLRFVWCGTTKPCTDATDVYGQPDFASADPGVGPDRLNAPSAVALDPNGGFWVADTGNNRVVHFKLGSKLADRVLGQPDFTHGDRPSSTSNATLSAPEGVAVAPNGDVFVSDTGANRVLKFAFVPSPDACDDGDPCTDDSIGPSGCQHFLTGESGACRPYACDTSTRTCLGDCTRAACDPPWICTGRTCALPCDSSSACASGFCVDSWCCDTACSGTCEACDVPGLEGTCSAFSGLPQLRKRGTTCFSPNGSIECGGQCDGVNRDACKPKTVGASCGTRSCAFGRENIGGSCDGAGACIPESRECFPYACGPGACRTSCVGDDECAGSARCIDGACIEGSRAITSVGGSCATSFAEVDFAPLAAVVALALAARRRRSAR